MDAATGSGDSVSHGHAPAGPGAVTVLLFMSYADEDREIAREIADRLSKEDVSVYSPQHDGDLRGLAGPEPECAIQRADAFLALLSPGFLTSPACRREQDLAEYRSRADGVADDFIQVLKIRQTPHHHSAALESRPWLDLTGGASWDNVLSGLAAKIGSADGTLPPAGRPPDSTGGRPPRPSPHFRNRDGELDEIVGGITDEYGEQFWLIIAPPQLGKTWLLQKISANVEQSWWRRWTPRIVDVRELSADVIDDAEAILLLLFGLDRDSVGSRPIADVIASEILRNRRFQLCLLDSAELLADSTVAALRQQLSDIHARLSAPHGSDVRLAFVAASRRESEWKGVSPPPRLQIRRLTEFSVEVFHKAVQDLAQEMNCRFSPAELQQIARRLHVLSEGLPALLAGCLRWIREHGWGELELLEQWAVFEEIAGPYIEQVLLSASGLSVSGSAPASDERAAIGDALLALSPYRFLTMSHLSEHVGNGALRESMRTLRWSVTDLWNAVSGTDLLFLPLREPWHEVYGPIRRLLCRRAYPLAAERGTAHREACDYMQAFMPGVYGSDQARVLVECLWHEAQATALAGSAEVEPAVISLARRLSAQVAAAPRLDQATIRGTAARLIEADKELADAVGNVPGLLARVAQTVRQP